LVPHLRGNASRLDYKFANIDLQGLEGHPAQSIEPV
jgi:hypothetical protein